MIQPTRIYARRVIALQFCVFVAVWHVSEGADAIAIPDTSATDGAAGHPSDAAFKLCALTKGSWCAHYLSQPWHPFKPVPRGSKRCPADCSGNGNCNADTGLCECPAGWTGASCSEPLKRPCTNSIETSSMGGSSNLMGQGRDRNWTEPGWTAGRCAGYCDAIIGMCWCDVSSRYGHRLVQGSYAPWHTGRPMGDDCHLSTDEAGNKLDWGGRPFESLYGKAGWCNADVPVAEHVCGCVLDGQVGELCDIPTEQFCLNQCSLHGDCLLGFCKCHAGWYGADCSRRVAGSTEGVAGDKKPRPWLQQLAALPPAAQAHPREAAPGHRRKRPYIYVYDMPPAYTGRMLQYRLARSMCAWRTFHEDNSSEVGFNNYALETLLHELLLQSSHRTFDPEEADFFYVPVYTSCYIHPVFAYNDFPWWYAPRGPRVSHTAMMTLEAKRWIQQAHPYWNRTGGADHMWLFTHDEGACWAPTEVAATSIILTHWGRMDKDHKSNTAYDPDNYNEEHMHPKLQPEGWLKHIQGHPCYDPAKDLVLPVFKPPSNYLSSPFLAALAGKGDADHSQRDILLFLRGDVGKHRLSRYSRGIRQKVFKLAQAGNWKAKHNILVGDGKDVPGDYSQLLARAKFCLVVPGDGWSARAEDAVLHGCVPVVIMDNVHAVLESALDWGSFSLRVAERDVEQLPQLLHAVSSQQLATLQAGLAKVWHRFTYFGHAAIRQQLAKAGGVELRKGGSGGRLGRVLQNDAFGTLMQWLSGRMKSKHP